MSEKPSTNPAENEFGVFIPRTENNQKLEQNVFPPDWENPIPSGRYNLVVIGGGTAGLVSAAGAAGLGAKVALIERHMMGGDCLNVGCVPSKGIIAAGRAAAAVRNAAEFGVHVPEGVSIDFTAAMERMRKLRADISPVDSAQRFTDLGIDVFLGGGKFVDRNKIEVGGQTLEFKKAVIATGARAAAPPIDGLENVSYLTNETFFSLTELPKRLGVIGAGPIGAEMAQTFAQLGSEVTLVASPDGLMPREDRDAAEVVHKRMEADGVKITTYGRELKLQPEPSEGEHAVRIIPTNGEDEEVVVDRLLIAVGRAPNIEGLGLEEAGVEYSEKGVVVNDKLQTTNSAVYAAGDICSPYQFTHAADFMARTVIGNALFLGRGKHSALTIPWATYTSPELAHVGESEATAKDKGIEIDTYIQSFEHLDRAILEGETDGFVKIHTEKGKDKIIGATIVAGNAGDIISQISQAMTHKIGLGKLASVISPYPTQAEAVRKVGDAYRKTKLTPIVIKILQKWLNWTQ